MKSPKDIPHHLPGAQKRAEEREDRELCSPAAALFFTPVAKLFRRREAWRGLTGAGLEVLIDEEAFRALADVGLLRVQTQLLTAVVLLRTVIHSCVCHTRKHKIT